MDFSQRSFWKQYKRTIWSSNTSVIITGTEEQTSHTEELPDVTVAHLAAAPRLFHAITQTYLQSPVKSAYRLGLFPVDELKCAIAYNVYIGCDNIGRVSGYPVEHGFQPSYGAKHRQIWTELSSSFASWSFRYTCDHPGTPVSLGLFMIKMGMKCVRKDESVQLVRRESHNHIVVAASDLLRSEME